MNAERFHALLRALDEDMQATNVRQNFAALVTALQNQVNSPAEASYQTAVAEARRALRAALEAAPSNTFPPSWIQAVKEMEIDHLLGSALAEDLETTFTELAATPAAILEWAQKESGRQDTLKSKIDNGLDALNYFEVGADTLEPGSFELTMLVPRQAVHEHMGEMGREFSELERIMLPFVELATGSRPALKVKSISSSDFIVTVALLAFAASKVADGIERVLDIYKKWLDVKEQRLRMNESGVPEEALAQVDAHVNTIIEAGINDVVAELTVTHSQRLDEGRVNELRTELRLSLNAIANRIDKGYHLEVRAAPMELEDSGDDDTSEPTSSEAAELIRHIENVQQRSKSMRYFEAPGTPMLSLPEGEHPGPDDGEPPAPKPRRSKG